MNQFKQLTISSLQKNISQIERFVEEICDENYISANYFGNIMLAIEEAVKNAIVHGNKIDGQKKVIITFQRKKDGLSFIIEDEGEGFNHQNIPNPIDSEDVSGNGIFLMRSLADKLNFNAKGNQVELVFSVSSISQETTLNRISQLKKYFTRQKSLAKH
jgi:serine/threonine-protein kinase RsbW